MTKEVRDEVNFEGSCKSNQTVSLLKDAVIDSSRNNLKVLAQEGNRRLFIEIACIHDDNQGINLSNLQVDVSEPELLGWIMKRSGLVDKPAALGKLIQAFISNHASGKDSGANNEYNKTLNLQSENAPPNESYQILPKKSSIPIHAPIRKPLCFGCKVTAAYLRAVILKMNNKLHFLAPCTSVDDFVEVLMCEDLTKMEKLIYLGCKTTEFKSIIKFLQRDFTSLRFKNIERSGLFISCLGTTLSGSNISSANCTGLDKKHFLENILR